MRFHVLNTSRSPHTEEKRAACPESIGLMFRLRGQPIYHRTARWVTVEDLVQDVERVCFGVRYGIIEVRYNSPLSDPLDEEALRGVVEKVQLLTTKVVKGKEKDISAAFAHLDQKQPQKKAPPPPKTKKVKKEPEKLPEPVPEPELPDPVPEPEVEPEPPVEEVPEQTDDVPSIDDITVGEIQERLDAEGIEYKSSMKKVELYELLVPPVEEPQEKTTSKKKKKKKRATSKKSD